MGLLSKVSFDASTGWTPASPCRFSESFPSFSPTMYLSVPFPMSLSVCVYTVSSHLSQIKGSSPLQKLASLHPAWNRVTALILSKRLPLKQAGTHAYTHTQTHLLTHAIPRPLATQWWSGQGVTLLCTLLTPFILMNSANTQTWIAELRNGVQGSFSANMMED